MATSLSDAGLQFANGTIQSSAAQDMIMPIAASVAANALTVSLPPEALVFRSTTLSSGASTPVQTNTTISLTVPSGATLGTINGIASRLVVLAIFTGTAVELAIVNISGGNQLDETNLISTTAISTGSTSANVIYSTTARTNVPYRVMGFVDSTQATAGTWATAPSLVQGVGGQALAALSSLGFGQTWQNVTAQRVSGTTYYNTTGKPITVLLSIQGVSGTLSFSVNGASIASTSTGTAYNYQTTYVVPAQASYSASFAAGAVTQWSELR